MPVNQRTLFEIAAWNEQAFFTGDVEENRTALAAGATGLTVVKK
jgi:hypothetical protein